MMTQGEWRAYQARAMRNPSSCLLAAEEHIAKHVGKSWSCMLDRAIEKLDDEPETLSKTVSSVPSARDVSRLLSDTFRSPRFMSFYHRHLKSGFVPKDGITFTVHDEAVTGYGVTYDANGEASPFLSHDFRLMFKPCDEVWVRGKARPAPFGCGLVTLYPLDNHDRTLDLTHELGYNPINELIRREPGRTVTPTYEEVAQSYDLDSHSHIETHDLSL